MTTISVGAECSKEYYDFFDKHYYESGPQSGKSLYQNYRWIPELTIPLAYHILTYINYKPGDTIMDFGCAKGYLTHAFRLLGADAWGVDISEYAINEAPREIQPYIKQIKPYEDDWKYCDHMICKDILEHIPYEYIDKQMEIIRSKSKTIFAIIPVGFNDKYIIPAYELDESHHIRESTKWWKDKFNTHSFFNVEVTTDLGPFKANWQSIDSKGNVLIYGY